MAAIAPSDSDIKGTFNAMLSAIYLLAESVLDSQICAWTAPFSVESDSLVAGGHRKRIAESILDIWHRTNEDGRLTRNYYGMCAVSDEVLDQVVAVNCAKSALEDILAVYLDAKLRGTKGFAGDNKKRPALRNEVLSRIGLERLHLRQAYRKLPILERKPAKIGFSWYQKGRSIKKISVKEAESLLSGCGHYHVATMEIELKKLAALPENEPLARVQDLSPQLRVNPVWHTYNEGVLSAERRALNVALPIFMPHEGDLQLPIFNPNFFAQDRAFSHRLSRSDIRVQLVPYLPGLRIHRYLHR